MKTEVFNDILKNFSLPENFQQTIITHNNENKFHTAAMRGEMKLEDLQNIVNPEMLLERNQSGFIPFQIFFVKFFQKDFTTFISWEELLNRIPESLLSHNSLNACRKHFSKITLFSDLILRTYFSVGILPCLERSIVNEYYTLKSSSDQQKGEKIFKMEFQLRLVLIQFLFEYHFDAAMNFLSLFATDILAPQLFSLLYILQDHRFTSKEENKSRLLNFILTIRCYLKQLQVTSLESYWKYYTPVDVNNASFLNAIRSWRSWEAFAVSHFAQVKDLQKIVSSATKDIFCNPELQHSSVLTIALQRGVFLLFNSDKQLCTSQSEAVYKSELFLTACVVANKLSEDYFSRMFLTPNNQQPDLSMEEHLSRVIRVMCNLIPLTPATQHKFLATCQYMFDVANVATAENKQKMILSIMYSPSRIMNELFQQTSLDTSKLSLEMLMKDFKEIFFTKFVTYFPEFLLYGDLSLDEEGSPEVRDLSKSALIFKLTEDKPDLLPLPEGKTYNEEYDKAVIKLLYAYLMIRNIKNSTTYNFFFDISAEYYKDLLVLLEYNCSNDEAKLIFLYGLAMNDLGKTNKIIREVKEKRLIAENEYVDHDEKWYLFLKHLGKNAKILPGWNSVQFSSDLRNLYIEGMSTSFNFPQMLQGENIKLCVKRFCEYISRPAQLFRLVTQVVDMAGAWSDVGTWKSNILKKPLFEHAIVGIYLILSEREEAYEKYLEVVFRKEIDEFFSEFTLPEKLSKQWKFFYARIAALCRLNDHQKENIRAIHAAWSELSVTCTRLYAVLCEELLITGCNPLEKAGILVYFAPAVMDKAIAIIKGIDHSPETLAKGIFYGLQGLAQMYEIGRKSFENNECKLKVISARTLVVLFKKDFDKLLTNAFLSWPTKTVSEVMTPTPVDKMLEEEGLKVTVYDKPMRKTIKCGT